MNKSQIKKRKDRKIKKQVLGGDNKRKKLTTSLAFFIIGIFFMCWLASSIITFVATFIIDLFGGAQLEELGSILHALITLSLSCVIGMLIAMIIARIITRKAGQLNDTLNRVADGDFSVTLAESKIKLVNEYIKNFNTMIKELNSVALLRNDFISNFSHEFKTPIVSIKGFAELLKENKNLDEKQKEEFLQIIIDESSRLMNLATNTLLLSKLETSTYILDKKEFKLDEQIRQVVLLLDNEIKARDIKLEIHLSKIKFVGNEELLFQVWTNLVNNAIRYAKKNLFVYSKIEENYINIYIQDDGDGMNETTIKHIFDKYYQGENTSSNVGNGLGLSIAQKVVSLHNGFIQVESEMNKGSKFIVKLPIIK